MAKWFYQQNAMSNPVDIQSNPNELKSRKRHHNFNILQVMNKLSTFNVHIVSALHPDRVCLNKTQSKQGNSMEGSGCHG